jgi:hypothetical protein
MNACAYCYNSNELEHDVTARPVRKQSGYFLTLRHVPRVIVWQIRCVHVKQQVGVVHQIAIKIVRHHALDE